MERRRARSAKRRALLLAAGALAVPFGAAGQPARLPRIGVIIYSNVFAPTVEGLREGLKELGVADGKHITLDVVDAKGEMKAVEEAARRFERERVKLIYCTPLSAVNVVKRATSDVPIFFVVGTDPVASGLVASFAKPGGRLTGVNVLTVDLTGKRLELLKDLVPKTRRVFTLFNPTRPQARASVAVAQQAGIKLGIQVLERHARSAAEVRTALAALKPDDADAMLLVPDAEVYNQIRLVVDTARKHRMAVMGSEHGMAERGVLAAYGVDRRESGRQSANNVQRMLAGARPNDLPVENVTRVSFVLNLRAAREIGVVVPPAMLVRFDRVIE
jgi:putative ABC transport system substrate-binding protein